MGMILSNNTINEPATAENGSPTDNRTCLIIRTGNADSVARFYPGLYQLTLVKHGVEEKVDLGFSGSRLLERLARNPGEVIDRDELMQHAWPGRVVGQGSLNQQIYTLRQILADENAREIIQTLPRRGYFLNPNFVDLAIEAHPAATPNAAQASTPTATATGASVQGTSAPVSTPIAEARTQVVSGAKLSSLRKPLVPVLACVTALLAWGAIAYNQPVNNTNSMAAMGKLLTITYAPHHPDELPQMIPHGEKIERSLTSKLTAPLHVVIADLHENALDLVCLLGDGSARTLHLAHDRLDQLTDSDWAPCLK